MEFTLRNLCADDIFPVCQILSDIGLGEIKNYLSVDDVKAAIGSGEDAKDATAVGVALLLPLAGMVLKNLSKCRFNLYSFLSGVTGLKVEEIAALPPAKFVTLVQSVIKKEDFKDFFTAVLNVFSQMQDISA